MRIVVLAVAATILSASTAIADPSPPAIAPEPPGAHRLHAHCVATAGRPDLEEAEHDTLPNGKPMAHLCPPGQVLQAKAQGTHKTRVPLAERTSAEEGYFYVEDTWLKPKIYEAWFSVNYSAPVIPGTADQQAHSDMQDWLVNDNCNGFTPHTTCTIELGWDMERSDWNEGWRSPKPFCYYTASEYAETAPGSGELIQTGDCNITLSVPESEDVFLKHYYATDGSPESKCQGGISPCTAKYEWRLKQQKGAWWIGTNATSPVKLTWIGRVSDTEWGHVVNGKLTKPFVAAGRASVGGEVFDHPNNPETQMGNGNKGGCTCATQISTITLQRHRTAKEGGGVELEQEFWNEPLAGVTWPQRYTAGQFSAARSEMHLGG